jgi:ferritin-like metal-binding protein YciE
MARAARNQDLRQAFIRQRAEAKGQQTRLGEVFRLFGRPVRAETSETVLGLLQDCEELLDDVPEPSAVTQALAHHQMSRYGTLLAWAEAMDRLAIVTLLRRSLEEERDADRGPACR